ncbi:MAG TPA: CcmD family protein [bacterium]|nr:CcmD family protein [bacterium]
MNANTTAVVGVLIVWAGIVWYLVRIDRRIKRGARTDE